MPSYNEYEDDDDDVEVVYDVPYVNGGGSRPGKQKHPKPRGGRTNGAARGNANVSPDGVAMIGNYVNFANVFDPFEQDQDALAEFFDDNDPSGGDSKEDWERPNMFNDPRKVGFVCKRLPVDSCRGSSKSTVSRARYLLCSLFWNAFAMPCAIPTSLAVLKTGYSRLVC